MKQDSPQGRWDSIISAFGYILAVSYPLLALSTGVRAIYQLFFRDDITYLLPPLMSAVAATCYLLATIGFVYRRRWTWWLSISTLGVETLLTFVVGGLSFAHPDLIGRTVWRHFGADYGYFPLFQPLIGLVWLLWPPTMSEYGIRPFWLRPAPHQSASSNLER
jgi:hypothetical protein